MIQMMADSSCGLSPKVVREIIFNLGEDNHIEYRFINKMCGRPPQYAPFQLSFDLLTLKVLSETRVTWATSVPILVFLGLSVLDLGPMYATDRQLRRQMRIIA